MGQYFLRHVSEDEDTAGIERKVVSIEDRPEVTATAKGTGAAGGVLQPQRLLQFCHLSDPLPPGAFCFKYISVRPNHKKMAIGRWNGVALDWVWNDRCIQNSV